MFDNQQTVKVQDMNLMKRQRIHSSFEKIFSTSTTRYTYTYTTDATAIKISSLIFSNSTFPSK